MAKYKVWKVSEEQVSHVQYYRWDTSQFVIVNSHQIIRRTSNHFDYIDPRFKWTVYNTKKKGSSEKYH